MSELLDRAQPVDPKRKPQPATAESTQPGSSANAAFAAALTELALTVHAGDCDPVTVITQCAVDLIPGTEYSALVIPAGPNQVEPRATSGEPTPQIIGLQNEVGEGPCLEAVAHGGPVWVPDLSRETRWPAFTAAAAELGVGSMMCTSLVARNRIYGSLSLASAHPHAFDDESQTLATIFAANATIALAGQEWHQNMTTALTSRDVIGQAKGILMERYRLTPDAAFALLVKASQHTHTKLRTVSEELCRTGELPLSGGVSPAADG
ncbi:MAG TPA: GAF and ANTAR domain-containing protein [Jatrophihabitans sp.]|jgi:transcriptional regulator with GAF, ATPase, and Fis domain|uniref:GAF and ANTAR domain-containing protein n=1 Tax=Jatrophihabitans sp. TaxID=1932789 RepID=UPI002F0501C4